MIMNFSGFTFSGFLCRTNEILFQFKIRWKNEIRFIDLAEEKERKKKMGLKILINHKTIVDWIREANKH